MKCYSELILLETFEDRFNYLKLDGIVGKDTFGFERYLNQRFYHSKEWKDLRSFIITRDLGCDLAVSGHEIYGRVYIHHLNPITTEDLRSQSLIVRDPEFLVCTSFDTHNAIHYGANVPLPSGFAERTPNDTCPWRKT